jgi:putative hemolysin
VTSLLAAALLTLAAGASHAWAMGNPASAYCISVGGRLEIRKDAQGGEAGYCHLPDGRVVEEWQLFRGANRHMPVGGGGNPASVYCTSVGGRLEMRQGPQGESGFCQLPDGRVVEEWQLFRGAHQPPR